MHARVTLRVLGKSFLIALVTTALVLGAYYLSSVGGHLPEAIRRIPPVSLGATVVASDIIELTNENRTETGLPSLRVNTLLMQAAQEKANDMAAGSYYAHTSPGGKTPLYWLDAVGYHYLNAGENLVIDRTTSQQVVDAWMQSPDHRENILRPQFTEIGVGTAQGVYEGLATTYVVQEFGTPYPTVMPTIARVIPQSVAQVAYASSTPAAPAPKKIIVKTAVKKITFATKKKNITSATSSTSALTTNSTVNEIATSTSSTSPVMQTSLPIALLIPVPPPLILPEPSPVTIPTPEAAASKNPDPFDFKGSVHSLATFVRVQVRSMISTYTIP
jgi:uncharacterized protein YkwD